MSDEIKILLTGDIHLGAEQSPVPPTMRVNTFKKITSLAREHDLLLIAGDLLDSPAVDDDLVELISNELKAVRAAGTEVILSPGKGELLPNGVVADVVKDIGCSMVFENPVYSEPFVFQKNGQEVFVYGKPAPIALETLKAHREKDEGFHIGLYYIDFSMEKNRSLVKGGTFDFFAMGSMHNFRMFKVHDRIIGVYPGSPEACDISESGERYVVSMQVNGNAIQSIKRLSVNSIRLKSELVDCGAYGGTESLLEDIVRKATKRELLNITLEGNRDFALTDDFTEKLKAKYYDVRLEDISLPTFNSFYKEFCGEESIRGEAFRILKEQMTNREEDGDIPSDSIRMILKKLIDGGIDDVEEWLCDMSNA